MPALGYDRIAERARRRRSRRGAQAALRRGDARRGAAHPVRRRRHREAGRRRARAARRSPGSRRRCSATPRRRSRRAAARWPLRRRGGRRPGSSPPAHLPPRRRAQRRATARPAPGTALPAEPSVFPSRGPPAAGAAAALVLVAAGLRPLPVPLLPRRACSACRASRRRPSPSTPVATQPSRGSTARVRGTLVHLLLEQLDFARPAAARRRADVVALGRGHGLELEPRAGRGHPRPGRRVRGLAAVRAARRRARRPPRGRLRVRARAGTAAARSSPASSTCSRASPTAAC